MTDRSLLGGDAVRSWGATAAVPLDERGSSRFGSTEEVRVNMTPPREKTIPPQERAPRIRGGNVSRALGLSLVTPGTTAANELPPCVPRFVMVGLVPTIQPTS